MAKRPAILFYTGDWIKDTALRCCSIGARGMWIDMICYMHDCQPYGHLKVRDKVILTANLAALVGLSFSETEGYLKELFEAGVCSKMPDGTIYSERMVKDESVRLARANGGIKGGNPLLKTPKPKKNKGSKKGYPSLEDVDVNENENREGLGRGAGEGKGGEPPQQIIVLPHPSESFAQAWQNWKEYKQEVKKFSYASPKSEQAALHSLNKLAAGREDKAIELIVYAIGRQWEGFYEIPTNDKNNGQSASNNRTSTGGVNASYKAKLAADLGFAPNSGTGHGI